MAPVGSSFFIVADRPPANGGVQRLDPSSSGFGASTTFRLTQALCLAPAHAIALGRTGVIVDLSGGSPVPPLRAGRP
jgi:hypothetical protein